MKTSEVLERALEKLGPNGEHWTQGAYARRADGVGTIETDSRAVMWCSSGALYLCDGSWRDRKPLLDAIRPLTIPGWNDHAADFSEIRAGFLRAIELARKQEQANDN